MRIFKIFLIEELSALNFSPHCTTVMIYVYYYLFIYFFRNNLAMPAYFICRLSLECLLKL